MIKFIGNYTLKVSLPYQTVYPSYEVYSAESKSEAMQFLSNVEVTEPIKHVVVETPEGSWGRDVAGIYDEGAAPYQHDHDIRNSDWGKREAENGSQVEVPTAGRMWLKQNGRWFLLGASVEEVGRNDPCPCGSGKKFKYCCIDGVSPPEPLLTNELTTQLPDFATMDEQVKHYSDYAALPIHIHYFHAAAGWHWYVLSGQPSDTGFDFFGYVVGWDDELGYFDLALLEHGFIEWCGKPHTRVQRDPDFGDRVLADVMSDASLELLLRTQL
jgi:hypothetical protein